MERPAPDEHDDEGDDNDEQEDGHSDDDDGDGDVDGHDGDRNGESPLGMADLSARLACFKLSMMIACVSGHLPSMSL